MQFVLEGGHVVIGTKIADGPETISVLTSTGVVSLNRAQIQFVDFGTPGRCTTSSVCSLRLGAGWTCMSSTCRWLPPSTVALQSSDPEEFDDHRSLRPVYERNAPGPRHRWLGRMGGISLGAGSGLALFGLITYATRDHGWGYDEFPPELAGGLMILGTGAMVSGLLMFAERAAN